MSVLHRAKTLARQVPVAHIRLNTVLRFEILF